VRLVVVNALPAHPQTLVLTAKVDITSIASTHVLVAPQSTLTGQLVVRPQLP